MSYHDPIAATPEGNTATDAATDLAAERRAKIAAARAALAALEGPNATRVRADRADGWTADRQRSFLSAIAEGHTVEAACRRGKAAAGDRGGPGPFVGSAPALAPNLALPMLELRASAPRGKRHRAAWPGGMTRSDRNVHRACGDALAFGCQAS